ncbi:hypothetical protein EV714DRAFT_276615 [Schizophyllum commune]
MSHPSCPTKLPDEVRHILDEFRQALHDNAERLYQTPTSQEGEEDTTPAWREHVAQFALMPIGRFYGSPAEPALVRNTHGHISNQASETIEHNIAHVFRKGEPAFLINSNGSGKTATLLQGLRQHWGFYFSSCLRDFASADLWEILAERRFHSVFLARLLLLHVFAGTLGVKHPPEKARDVWNSVQLSFQRGSNYPPALASAREHAVLLLSRIFATPRGPAEAFIFPEEVAAEWVHRYSDLVELRPGVWNNGNARYRTARHADYPASAALPLATDGASYATTLSWLRHEHEIAFCLLPDPTAFIFGFDGDYLWVIVRVGPSANCGPRKTNTSEALSLLASLPNPCKAPGDLPVLEVAMPIPDLNAPNRLERLNHRRYESPRPTKYRTVTVNPALIQFTEAVLEEATLTEREDEESRILSRMVANVVGETSISPDRHGRRRKVVSPLSQSDAEESIRSPSQSGAQAAVLEDSPSNPSSVASSQHTTQLKVRDASHVLTGNASKRKRSEASAESKPTSDELPPACKRSRIDSRSPTP